MQLKGNIISYYLLFNFILITNLLGQIDTAWINVLSGNTWEAGIDVEETHDKGFAVLSTNTNSVILSKTDSLGNLLWEKSFISDTRGRSLIETNDSGFVLLARKGSNKTIVIRADKNGDTLWTNTISGDHEWGVIKGFEMIENKNGDYIILGYSSVGDPDGQLWMAEVDMNGGLTWAKTISISLMDHTEGYTFIENDSGYFAALYEGHMGVIFVQLDTLGNILWQEHKRILDGLFQSLNAICLANEDYPDSGYVLTGQNEGTLLMVRTDTEANIYWAREYERFTPSMNYGYDVINDYDGGYVIVGGTHDNGGRKLFLVKTNREGDKKWDKVYDGFGRSISLTSDRGYVVSGAANYNKTLLLKLNSSPIANITTDSVWIDSDWNGYVTNALYASESYSPNGFLINNYEWKYKNEIVGNNSVLEIQLPSGDNKITLKVTDEYGVPNTSDFTVKVCSYKHNTSGSITSSISTMGDSVFFASSTDDQVYCFDNNNQQKWTLATGGDIQSTTTIGPNGNIYVGSDDTRLYCFDPKGNFEWDTPMGGIVTASPAITQERIIYVGTENNRLYSINGDDGDINWNYLTGGSINSSVAIASTGNIYFGSSDKKFYSLNSSGTLNWSYETGGEIHSSPAIDTLGRIYFGSDDKKLYVLNYDGTLSWSFTTNGAVKSSPVIDSEGNIYFGSSDGKFYCIDTSGNEIWSFDAGSSANGNPSLTKDGNVLFGCDDGTIYSLTMDGELNWSYKTEDSVVSAPLVTSDGRIYIGSSDNSIYGFIDPNSKTENYNHFWPTFQKDNKRTGSQVDIQTSVKVENNLEIPREFSLKQNYPNPFNPSTKIEFQVAETSEVMLKIYNINGEEVRTLVNEAITPGYYSTDWNGLNNRSEKVGSGIYFYKISVIGNNNSFVKTMKMIKLK